MTENTNSKFPSEADVVIVGVGGIVGSMIAYWLSELGQKNIVGLEKSSVIPSDIEPTIPPTPTMTTSASDGNFEFVFSVILKFNSNFLFCKLEFLQRNIKSFDVFLELCEVYI